MDQILAGQSSKLEDLEKRCSALTSAIRYSIGDKAMEERLAQCSPVAPFPGSVSTMTAMSGGQRLSVGPSHFSRASVGAPPPVPRFSLPILPTLPPLPATPQRDGASVSTASTLFSIADDPSSPTSPSSSSPDSPSFPSSEHSTSPTTSITSIIFGARGVASSMVPAALPAFPALPAVPRFPSEHSESRGAPAGLSKLPATLSPRVMPALANAPSKLSPSSPDFTLSSALALSSPSSPPRAGTSKAVEPSPLSSLLFGPAFELQAVRRSTVVPRPSALLGKVGTVQLLPPPNTTSLYEPVQEENGEGVVAIPELGSFSHLIDAKNHTTLRSQVVGVLGEMKKDMEKTVEEISQATARTVAQLRETEERLHEERTRRKALLNKVIDMQGSIRVFCRVRPHNEEDRVRGDHVAISAGSTDDELVVSGLNGNGNANSNAISPKPSTMSYDRVFGPNSTQEEVFNDVRPLVESCVDGYTVCIFAYGQTGSGKTYTMEGSENNPGVNFRALKELFAHTARAKNSGVSYQVAVSVVEIYNDQVRDLLLTGTACKDKLEVREGPEGVYVPGLTEVPVNNASQVRDLLVNQAHPNREVRGTSSNVHSSRSHCLLFVKCTGVMADGKKTLGKLILIDLAGSERLKKSEAVGQGKIEAQNINKSLSALGNVISALHLKASNPSQHVPFRDSKLTYLLQNSLGGACKCLMICQVSPSSSDLQESHCTLHFATRVRNTKLGVAKKHFNFNFSETADGNEQKSRVRQLEQQLTVRDAELKEKDRKIEALTKELASDNSNGFRRTRAALGDLTSGTNRDRGAKRMRDDEKDKELFRKRPAVPVVAPRLSVLAPRVPGGNNNNNHHHNNNFSVHPQYGQPSYPYTSTSTANPSSYNNNAGQPNPNGYHTVVPRPPYMGNGNNRSFKPTDPTVPTQRTRVAATEGGVSRTQSRMHKTMTPLMNKTSRLRGVKMQTTAQRLWW